MKWPRHAGVVPRQAHADLPEGTFEREFGQRGFFGAATHLLHARPPTGWIAIDGPLRPRAYDLAAAPAAATAGRMGSVVGREGPWAAPVLFHNHACELRWMRLEGVMDHLVRNADGDQLLFVHAGQGELFCDFGHLGFSEGDYLLLPRGSMWRLACAEPTVLLAIEATADVLRWPERGLVGQHAFIDPALAVVPSLDDAYAAQKADGPTEVVVKRAGQLTTYRFAHNPLDTVGYQGDLLPYRINWRQLRPMLSPSYHLPPSAHTTFVADRFVVCTFCPRPLESHPGALKVPFFHSNNDYDELLFYHSGDFFSRDGIGPGMVTLHPAGVPHGPHPKALAAAHGPGAEGRPVRTHTDEVAVMVDTLDLLAATEAAAQVEVPDYAFSWRADADAEVLP